MQEIKITEQEAGQRFDKLLGTDDVDGISSKLISQCF